MLGQTGWIIFLENKKTATTKVAFFGSGERRIAKLQFTLKRHEISCHPFVLRCGIPLGNNPAVPVRENIRPVAY